MGLDRNKKRMTAHFKDEGKMKKMMDIKPKKSNIINRNGKALFFLILSLLLFTILFNGCNDKGKESKTSSNNEPSKPLHRSSSEENPDNYQKISGRKVSGSHGSSRRTVSKSSLPSTSFGSKKMLNIPLPEKGKDKTADSSSIYYEDKGTTETANEDFVLSDWNQSAESGFVIQDWKEIPQKTPAVPDNTPVSSEFSPIVPARTPENTTVAEPTKPEPKTPAANNENDSLEEELKRAEAIKEKAFVRYTKLATTGGEGDINQALKEYREAVARVKELKRQIGRQ